MWEVWEGVGGGSGSGEHERAATARTCDAADGLGLPAPLCALACAPPPPAALRGATASIAASRCPNVGSPPMSSPSSVPCPPSPIALPTAPSAASPPAASALPSARAAAAAASVPSAVTASAAASSELPARRLPIAGSAVSSVPSCGVASRPRLPFLAPTATAASANSPSDTRGSSTRARHEPSAAVTRMVVSVGLTREPYAIATWPSSVKAAWKMR